MMRARFTGVFLLALLASGMQSGSSTEAHRTPTAQSESVKLLASDGAALADLGEAVAISENTAVVGAPGDSDNGVSSGSVYVFEKDGEDWEEEKLLARDGLALDSFGTSVGISGETIVVGAILGDDNTLRTGSAYVFDRERRGWEEKDELVPPDGEELDQFGYSVAISDDTVVVGAPEASDLALLTGKAYVFTRSGTRWSFEDTLTPINGGAGDRLGYAVAVSEATAVVGAPHADDNGNSSGKAIVFADDRGRWSEEDELVASDAELGDQLGYAVGVFGDIAVVGAPYADGDVESSGAAYVFVRDGDEWEEHTKLEPTDGNPGDEFGKSVSISGDHIVIGAPENEGNGSGEGAAYLFVRTHGEWIEREKLLSNPRDDDLFFGQSVSVLESMVLVGTPGASDDGAASGAAYAFQSDYVFTLTVTPIGTGTGSVSSTPSGIDCGQNCSEDFTIDTEVDLVSTAETDSVFVGWGGDIDCADGLVTMTEDLTCTAQFDLRTHTLTILKTGSGSGTVTTVPPGIDCGADCDAQYSFATEVTLVVDPVPPSLFIGWSSDADCVDGQVTMTSDRTCEADFHSEAVFSDGFESGDLTAWPTTWP